MSSSNYKFAFLRAPVRQVAPTPIFAPLPAAGAASRTPVTSANRFSVNRLIHVKNSGGCRSCG